MRDVAQLTVTQIRIFPVDVIPLRSLLTKTAKERFQSALAFGDAGPFDGLPIPVQPDVLALRRGTVKLGKTLVVVDRLEIDQRRVILQVSGPSRTANEVYKRITRIIGEFDTDRTFAHASTVFVSEETACVATLDFDFERLFAPQLLDLLAQKVSPLLSNASASASCIPKRFMIPVTYEVASEELTRHQISLVEKSIRLELRSATNPRERRYLTHSPCDSNTHMKLLEEFERAFGDSQ